VPRSNATCSNDFASHSRTVASLIIETEAVVGA
jgi:hypothetical protein